MWKVNDVLIKWIRFYKRAKFSVREVQELTGLSHGVIVKYGKGAEFDPEPYPVHVAEAREMLSRLRMVSSLQRNPRTDNPLSVPQQSKPQPVPSPPAKPRPQLSAVQRPMLPPSIEKLLFEKLSVEELSFDEAYAIELLRYNRRITDDAAQRPLAKEDPSLMKPFIEAEKYAETVIEKLLRSRRRQARRFRS